MSWEIPQSASPQLGYKLEAFAGSKAEGKLLYTYEDASPHVIIKRLDTKETAKSVRLTVTDIFDQKVAAVIPIEPIKLSPASSFTGKTHAGLRYKYYVKTSGNDWEKLPDFSTLTPEKQGYVNDLDYSMREGNRQNYAIQYEGYLRVPSDGLYVISAGTCDGSRMYVGGKLIADNDGIRSTTEKRYHLALSKGLHAFKLEYFRGGDHGESKKITKHRLQIHWEGPGFDLRRLNANDFLSEDTPDLPSLSLALDGALKDNMPNINIDIKRHGHKITKLQLFTDLILLSTKTAEEIGDKDKVDLSILLSGGDNRVWARIWYDDRFSMDSSNDLKLEAKNFVTKPWQFTEMLDGDFPMAVRSDADSASFAGEGYGYVYQKIEGDFTITAHIADIIMKTKDNGMWFRNWIGLSILPKHNKSEMPGEPYRANISIFLTSEGIIKGTNDHPDLGGSNVSDASFGKNLRWLRLVRRGVRYQSYVSEDGKTWQKADERTFGGLSKEHFVGVCFKSEPNKSSTMFRGMVDNISLKLEVEPEKIRRIPSKADLRLENRLTAIVQAPKNPEVLYARSVDRGLLKSSDRGETWAAVNNGLTTPDAMAVRSVAVHPENSSIVLRAGGSVVNGELKSGLWKSQDAGKSWKLVTSEIDFDGRGPTTLFGEVIMFSLSDPDLVVAGGETKGLFISRDAGETWQYFSLKGERITCMGFGVQGVLAVGTFADSEFERLGLPKPVSQVEASLRQAQEMPGRIYWMTASRNSKKTISKPTKVLEFEAFGVANMSFDAHQNFAHFATTRGIYYTWVHCAQIAQRMHYDMPADELYTAIGARGMKDPWSNYTCTAPFSGEEQGPVYFTKDRGRIWKTVSGKTRIEGEKPDLRLNAGISCVLPDKDEAKTIYLCNSFGIFKTTDEGKSYKLIYK